MAAVPRLAFVDGYLLAMLAVVWGSALARRPQTRAWVRFVPAVALGIQLVTIVAGLVLMTRGEEAAGILDLVQLASTLGIAGCLLADLVGTVQSFAAPAAPPPP